MKKINYSKKNVLIIIVSVVIAVLSLRIILYTQKIAIKGNEIKYIKAVDDLKPGDIITGDKITEDFYSGEVKEGYIMNSSDIEGLVVKEKIYKDEPIVAKRIAREIEDPENMKKKYSIKLLPEDAVAGTLREGDRVNIIGTSINSTVQSSSEYILKDENGQPASIKILKSFDSNGATLSSDNMPAGMYILDITEEEAIRLDEGLATKKIKLIKDIKND
ncbi:MAG: hypothetical protein RSA57_03690 [Cetobacterium sp.]|uniref:SAF domain-containing protein n=1 Tax=Bacteria TaxID=2 RepID=UPI002FC79F5D